MSTRTTCNGSTLYKDLTLGADVAVIGREAGGQQRTKDQGFDVLQGRAVGGGTTVNWTTSFRAPDIALNGEASTSLTLNSWRCPPCL